MPDPEYTPSEAQSALRLLVITPVFNEARHLARVASSIAAQTRTPDLWIVVDDGSVDGTLDLLRRFESERPFLRVISLERDQAAVGDGLARAREIRAFNIGLRAAGDGPWDLIAKVDGDIELPPDYFEYLSARFRDRYVEGLEAARAESAGVGSRASTGP